MYVERCKHCGENEIDLTIRLRTAGNSPQVVFKCFYCYDTVAFTVSDFADLHEIVEKWNEYATTREES